MARRRNQAIDGRGYNPALANVGQKHGLTQEAPIRRRQIRSGGVVVDLEYPITLDTVEPITSLTFRRPQLGDLRGMSLDDADLSADEMIDLIERLSGLTNEQVNAIDFEDLESIGDALNGFFGKSKAFSAD